MFVQTTTILHLYQGAREHRIQRNGGSLKPNGSVVMTNAQSGSQRRQDNAYK